MNNKNLELIPCPYCGGKPKLIRCGNWKECYAYICRNCYKTPIPYGEAKTFPPDAKKTLELLCY